MLKHLRNIVLFTLIAAGLFAGVQYVLQPKWNYSRLPESTRLSLSSFDGQDEDVDEVLFFGNSHGYYGISPMLMYEEDGIIGWNLSSAGQPLGVSYYLLKHALKTQSPSMVVLDVGMLAHYYDGSANWRYILDDIDFDADKIEMAMDYEDMVGLDYEYLMSETAEIEFAGYYAAADYENEYVSSSDISAQSGVDSAASSDGAHLSETGSASPAKLIRRFFGVDSDYEDSSITEDSGYFWSGLFSILQYHGRWKELSKSDFTDDVSKAKVDYYSNGYYMNPLITSSKSSTEDIEAAAAISYADVLEQDLVYERGVEYNYESESYLYSPAILPQADAWIKRIRALCDEAGARLLLVKVPVHQYITDYDGAWNKVKSDMVRAYADEQGLDFLDMQFDTELGIDWNADTLDGGAHLNYHGASKVSSFLGSYLASNYGIGGQDNALMDAKLVTYDKMAELAELEMDRDTVSYLNRLLENRDRYIICMAVNNVYLSEAPDDILELLSAFGLKAVSQAHDNHDSYLAYIDAGEVVFEQLSNRPVYWNSLSRGVTDIDISMESSGWYTKSSGIIRLDGRNLAANIRGLNVLVIDKATHLPLDSILTDALDEPYFCGHMYTTEFHAGYWLGTED